MILSSPGSSHLPRGDAVSSSHTTTASTRGVLATEHQGVDKASTVAFSVEHASEPSREKSEQRSSGGTSE